MTRQELDLFRSTKTIVYIATLGLIVTLFPACEFADKFTGFVFSPTATPLRITADCTKAIEPTDEDVKYALAFVGNTFDPESWDRSYTVESMSISVSWFSKDKTRIAFLEYLIYACGFRQVDSDYILSDQTLRDVHFAGYQNLKRVAGCSKDNSNLRLYEFTAQHSQKEYLLRFWASPHKSTRLLTLSLMFPESSRTDWDRYSAKLFSQLPACPK